ncbi:hypothetical protein [Streptosporangium sp. NPDC002607]
MLPAYRRVYLRLFAEAPSEDSGAIAAELSRVLGEHGEVTVKEDGRYWKMPECLEFNVELTPGSSVAECIDDLGDVSGWKDTGSDDDVWIDHVWNWAGENFLHPTLRWAHLCATEAPFPPPRFESGYLVIIRDCQTARDEELVGAEATVIDYSHPLPDAWQYVVLPVGRDRVETFDEHELEPGGPRAAADGEPIWISVSRNGEITGSSKPLTR